MKDYTYKENMILQVEDRFYVYLLNADGDIDEYKCDSLEQAKDKIDRYARIRAFE